MSMERLVERLGSERDETERTGLIFHGTGAFPATEMSTTEQTSTYTGRPGED